MFFLREWVSVNEKEKDAEWANRIISFIRMYQQPLVNLQHAQAGMAYLLGIQDMSAIRNLFQDPSRLNLENVPYGGGYSSILGPDGKPVAKEDANLCREMIGVNFRSLPIMEKTRNMLIAEMKKMGVVLTTKCDDPTATIHRKNDEALIKDKDQIEGLLNYVYSSIGEQPFKIEEYENRFGEKAAQGNVNEFQTMGLANKNPSDVKFFMDNFYKLAAEIAAGMPVDYFMRKNQVEEVFFENWTTDMIAKKAIAAQLHVSKLNGLIVYDYVTPETVFIFGGGRRKDYNDANAKAYQQQITIKDLLDRVGDSFDFENELGVLFQAVYACSNGTIDITGIGTDGRTGATVFNNSTNGATYSYNQFMNLNVTFGYIEFLSPNDTEYGDEFKKSDLYKKYDNKAEKNVNSSQPPNGKRYQNKARYEVPTYCSYYLVLNAYEQRLFNFGKVPYQQIEGYNDYDANWTILTYKEIGESIALNCAPFVDIINEAWYKWRFEVRRAKPRGTDYNYDSILDIAESTFTDTNLSRADKLTKMISWLDASANSLWKFPEVDGRVVAMSNTQLNIDKPNGLTPEIMKWWEVINVTWDKMLSTIGLDAPLRQGEPGQARDSMNNQFKALEYSQNNTYYLPDSITYMTQQLAERTLLYVLDIIQFKDYDTMAYKALVDAVGEETLSQIAQLGKKSTHRYGIFVESLNLAPMKARNQARIDAAITNGKITNAEALLVEEIKSPMKQAVTLAYFEQRRDALAQQNAMQVQQAQAQALQQLENTKQQTEIMKGKIAIQVEQIKAHAMIQTHLINQRGGIAKAEMKHSADSRQIAEQANADMMQQQMSTDSTGKPTTPQLNLAVLPTGYPQGSVQPQSPPSALQQQMDGSEPMPTGAAL